MKASRWIRIFKTCSLEDYDELDLVSKILLVSRVCVLPMTMISVVIGGLYALYEGYFNLTIFLLVLAGFVAAHIADNLINDYLDYKSGIDTPDYFRSQYAPHPILAGLVDQKTLLWGFIVLTIFDMLIAIYLSLTVSYLILVLALVGLILSAFYAGRPINLKRLGLGEFAVAVVWGPIMIGGTYLALTSSLTIQTLLVSLPYALSVMLVLIGKHLDKYELDVSKGVKTLVVRLGIDGSLILGKALAISSIMLGAMLCILISPWMLTAVIAAIRIPTFLKAYSSRRPREKPKEWPVWPFWFVAWAFWMNVAIGFYIILGLAISIIRPEGSICTLLATSVTLLALSLLEVKQTVNARKVLSN